MSSQQLKLSLDGAVSRKYTMMTTAHACHPMFTSVASHCTTIFSAYLSLPLVCKFSKQWKGGGGGGVFQAVALTNVISFFHHPYFSFIF